MNKHSQIRTGVILSYISLFIGNIIPLIYTPIMLRILGQSEYGLYSLASSVVSYLGVLNFGIGGSMVRFISKCRMEKDFEGERQLLSLLLKLYAVFATLVIFVGVIISFNVRYFFDRGLNYDEITKMQVLVIVISVNTAITFVSSVFSSVTIAYERFVFRKLVDMFVTIATPFLNLFMLYQGFASIGLTISAVIINVIALLANVLYCCNILKIRILIMQSNRKLVKDIFSFSFFVFLGEVVNMLYWATDKVLLGAMIGTVSVAIYNLASTFNSIMQTFTTGISSFFMPRIVRITTEGNEKEIDQLFIRIGRISFYIVALILSGFIVFGRSFIDIWAGNGYEQVYDIALITMFPIAIPIIQSIGLQVLMAKNKHQFRSIMLVVVAIINLIFTYMVVPKYDVYGAAVVSCCAYVAGPGICMNWYYKKKIGLDVGKFWREILKMCPLIIMLTLCGVYVLSFLQLQSYWTILPAIVCYAGVYCLIIYSFIMNSYERDLVNQMVKKLTKIKRKI